MTKMVKCLNKLKLLPAVLVLLAAGCTQRDLHTTPSEDCLVLFETAGQLEMEATKASLPDGQTLRVVVYRRADVAVTNPANDVIVATNTYRMNGGALASCTVDVNGNNTGAGTDMKIKSGTYDFYAYGSATPLTGNSAVEGIIHGRDFIAAKSLNRTINTSLAQVALDFAHASSKVQLDVRPATGMTLTSLSASAARFNKMATSPAAFLIGSGITASAGNESSQCVIATFTDAGDNKSPSGDMIVLPKTSGDFDLEVDITLDGTGYTLGATVSDLDFEPHKHYKFKATVLPQGANLTLAILPWGAVTDNEELGECNEILIGSWDNIIWSASMGGSPSTPGQGTAPLAVGDWTEVNWSTEMGKN